MVLMVSLFSGEVLVSGGRVAFSMCNDLTNACCSCKNKFILLMQL
jgi:hypothetical protein